MNSHKGEKKVGKTPRLNLQAAGSHHGDLISTIKKGPHGISKGYDTIGLFSSQHLKDQAAKSRRRSKNRTGRSWLKVGDSIRLEIKTYKDTRDLK